MRSIALICLILLGAGERACPQSTYWVDSLKKKVDLAANDREKAMAYLGLARYFTGTNSELADQYADKAIEVAEMSRDRRLIVDVYLRNGDRYLNLSGLSGYIQRAIDAYTRARQVAVENGLDAGQVNSDCALSRAYESKGDNDKALSYSSQAVNLAGNIDDDTVRVHAYVAMGDAYLARNDKFLAFQNYLQALNTAELAKNETLLGVAYDNLRDFYAGIEEYDKAIDYTVSSMNLDRRNGNRNGLLGGYNHLGNLFTAKKDFTLAQKMYEHSIALADSMHFDLYKVNSYVGLFNMYFNNNEYAKGMAYLNAHPALSQFLNNANFRFFFDEAYGYAYADMGRFDSAYYYFRKAEPEMEKRANPFGKFQFYKLFAEYYRKRKDDPHAIAYYLKARDIGVQTKSLKLLEDCDRNLDSLYEQTGDFKTAYTYNQEYNLYKDSLKTLSRETDVLKMEVDNDNRQRERLAKEEEEKVRHRHYVQYMGLTAGLAGLFIILVMLGFFVVHTGTIRALGFFSFIFLFEFIILLADKQIHEWTHGEPWKILLIKIFLAAGLLPLHHWLEHKVIHYLTSRRKHPLRKGASGQASPGHATS
ncbi:MAG: hypothetical protein Q8927_02830 [Bacteroidota bacterium]|nr:hypothetical protein [Bacteroidota bacterium]MDP4215108.1 hypothetical protein [Bacteroidota bacterium]MDP4245147.1 hypothetical protein [Bacteroidota bacterium]MDP4254437.1 hypothetical protein [Bacteroidota bacterium]MDP4259450.1 hypothetical protein [Bacteroidota bacterium]